MNKELPQTDSIQEMARFWETHDITDFEDHLEEVSDVVFERSAVLPVRLESTEVEAVRKIAKDRGLADVDLVRQWILEKIHVG